MSQITPLLDNENLLYILSLSKTATAVHVGEDAVIQFANEAMLTIWGKDNSVIGKSLEDALPELMGQPFIEMFARVWREGLTISGSDTAAELMVNGILKTFYFDFEYRAILNVEGKTIGILHSAIDVTDRFFKQRVIKKAMETEESLSREQQLNEELAASNEELSAINEELQQTQESLNDLNNVLGDRVKVRTQELSNSVEREQAMNEELTASNEELFGTVIELEKAREDLDHSNLELRYSEQRLDDILRQLPSPVVVLRGPNQVIEVTNEAILSFWNKSKAEVTGRPMLEVFPELTKQRFPAQWKKVYETGEIVINKEVPVNFLIDGEKRLSYVDYHYQPISDIDGTRSGVLATVIDVTNKVVSRMELEALNNELAAINEEMTASNEELIVTQENLNEKIIKLAESEEKLKIAIETGRMGTWSIDPATLKVSMSNFVKQMIGLPLDKEPEMEAIMQAVQPEYHQMLEEILGNAINKGLPSDTEYAINNLVTGEEKWVRATGKVLLDASGKPAEYTGIFMDITERKLDEIRKNDFIGMVSHELKTPLTSLTAIVQVANAKLKNSEDAFLSNAMEKANMQVKKMSTMINGFLNISRLESGKIQMDKKQFDLEKLVAQVIDETKLTTSAHTIELSPCQPVLIEADADKIGTVITNLLSNAVKYSPTGRHIEVHCERIEHSVRVSVKDEGMGIRQEDMAHLFDRYYRVENPNYRHISGFGIGLYLSAEIIHQHGGDIWVESNIGEGSTFFFSLPVN